MASLLALLGFLFAASAPGPMPLMALGQLCSANGATAPDPAASSDHECCLLCQAPLAAAPAQSPLPLPGSVPAERLAQPATFAVGRLALFAQARAPPPA